MIAGWAGVADGRLTDRNALPPALLPSVTMLELAPRAFAEVEAITVPD